MDYSSSGGYGNNTRNTTVRYTQELARPRAYYRPQELAASAPREQQVQQGERSQARGGGSGGEEETGSVTAEWRPAIKSVQRRLNRVWRVSIFILFLVLLATIVHIVQFFIPSGLTNQLYANIVQGNRASVRQAPETPFIIRPFVEANTEQGLSQKGVMTDSQIALYAADIPRGRGFVKRKDKEGTEMVYAVSAMHQLRCLFLIQSSFTMALLNASALDIIQRRNVYHCLELIRQAVRCDADPTLDPAFNLTNENKNQSENNGTTATATNNSTRYASLGWGSEHICRDYSKLYDFAVENRADDSMGLDVDYGFTVD